MRGRLRGSVFLLTNSIRSRTQNRLQVKESSCPVSFDAVVSVRGLGGFQKDFRRTLRGPLAIITLRPSRRLACMAKRRLRRQLK